LGTAATTLDMPHDQTMYGPPAQRPLHVPRRDSGPYAVSTKRGWECPKAAGGDGPDCCPQGRELGGRFSHLRSRRSWLTTMATANSTSSVTTRAVPLP